MIFLAQSNSEENHCNGCVHKENHEIDEQNYSFALVQNMQTMALLVLLTFSQTTYDCKL